MATKSKRASVKHSATKTNTEDALKDLLQNDLHLIKETVPLPYRKLVGLLKGQGLSLYKVNTYLANIPTLPPVTEEWFKVIKPIKGRRYLITLKLATFLFADSTLRNTFLVLLTNGFSEKEVYDILSKVTVNFPNIISPEQFHDIVSLYWDTEVIKDPVVWMLFIAHASIYMSQQELELLQQAYTGYDFLGLVQKLGLPVFGAKDPRSNSVNTLSWIIRIVTTRLQHSKNATEINKLWNVVEAATKMLETYTEGDDLIEKLNKLRIPLKMETPNFETKHKTNETEDDTAKRAKPKKVIDTKTLPSDPLGFKKHKTIPKPKVGGVLTPPDIYSDEDDIPTTPY